jgi:hypothetical protein
MENSLADNGSVAEEFKAGAREGRAVQGVQMRERCEKGERGARDRLL